MIDVITGAAGFLGYHLSRRLLAEGRKVLGVDNFQTGSLQNISDLQAEFKNFTFIEGDILHGPTLARAGEILPTLGESKLSHIYHLACPASPPLYQKDELNTLDICYKGTQNVLDFADKQQARVMLASTSEIYGDPEVHPQPESYRGNVNTMGPRSCYDEGKRVLETLGYIYSCRGLEVRTARIFNTYGPRMSPLDGRVMTNFIKQALLGEALTVYGDGSQTRSLCYCDDLIEGFLLLMSSDLTEPVNLGSQQEFSVLELAKTVREKINPKLEIVFEELPKDDPKVRRPDTSRALKALGWSAKVSLSQGIDQMIADFRNQLDRPIEK